MAHAEEQSSMCESQQLSRPVIPRIFESERLLIKAPHSDDAEQVFAAIAESRDYLRPWMPWAESDQDVVSVAENLRVAHEKYILGEDLRLNVWRKSDDLFVGGSGLHRIDWSVPRFEIGYWVRQSLQGKGYVTEAVLRIRDMAFADLAAERVEIRCDAANRRSSAVALRANFVLEATLRNDGRNRDGVLTDSMIFSMLRSDWLALGNN